MHLREGEETDMHASADSLDDEGVMCNAICGYNFNRDSTGVN